MEKKAEKDILSVVNVHVYDYLCAYVDERALFLHVDGYGIFFEDMNRDMLSLPRKLQRGLLWHLMLN